MGLDTVEIVMAIEDEFGIKIDDERASEMRTVRDTHEEVVRLLIAAGRPDTPGLRDEVMRRIIDIAARQMEMDPSLIMPESDWIRNITQD